MEIPDVIVINKSDHPLTDTMVREIRGVLSLANLERTPEEVRGSWRVPIVRTEANRGEGVAELVQRLDEHRKHILAAGQLGERRGAQPAQRGAGDRHGASAPAPGGGPARGPGFQELLEEVVAATAGPGERGHHAAGAGRDVSSGPSSRLAEAMATGILDLADRSWPVLLRLMGGHTAVYTRHRRSHRTSRSRARHRCCCSTTSAPAAATARTSPLVYARDGENLILVASKGGYPKNPAWFHNLMANPDTTIQVGSERRASCTRVSADCRGAQAAVAAGREASTAAMRAISSAPSGRSRWSCSKPRLARI